MGLEERVYSVLVVSTSEKFNSALLPLLSEVSFSSVHFASGIGAAQRMLTDRSFDFVIVNSPLRDDPGVRFAIDACAAGGTVVLLLVKSEVHPETFDRVWAHGVFTLAKPTSLSSLAQALRWMASARERLRRADQKTLSIEEKMEEIRLVNRAKWLLISQLNMTEPDAHHYLEKQAMDQCISKRQMAENIIGTYS